MYARYQETKQRLIEYLQQWIKLSGQFQGNNEEIRQHVRDATEELKRYINALSDVFNEMQAQVNSYDEIRRKFDINNPLTQKDMDNYYGVYVYNLMIDAMKKKLNSLTTANIPNDIFTSSEIITRILIPEAKREHLIQTQLQRAYQNTLEDLIRDVPNEDSEMKWYLLGELKISLNRTTENGIIDTAYDNAIIQFQSFPVVKSKVNDLIESLFNYDYALTKIANERMFENDLSPTQINEGATWNIASSVVEEAKKKNSNFSQQIQNQREHLIKTDIAWRRLPTLRKKYYIQFAKRWADEKKIPSPISHSMYLLRLLKGIASKLGLRFFQYAPLTNNNNLQNGIESIRGKSNNIINQIRAACISDTHIIQNNFRANVVSNQRVIQPEILTALEGYAEKKQEPHPSVQGWFLMNDTDKPEKLYGIIHGRKTSMVDGYPDFSLQTTDIGVQQGVPQVQNLKNSLDITYVCSQRLKEVIYFNERVEYAILGKEPRHLGTLMILWMICNAKPKEFDGLMLDVVRSENEGKEGFSFGKTDSNVAAYYQRYFKFQRTHDLDQFSVTPSLIVFHPDWKAYQYQGGNKNDIMYRPYPTGPDLLDMIARLVYNIKSYYGIDEENIVEQ